MLPPASCRPRSCESTTPPAAGHRLRLPHAELAELNALVDLPPFLKMGVGRTCLIPDPASPLRMQRALPPPGMERCHGHASLICDRCAWGGFHNGGGYWGLSPALRRAHLASRAVPGLRVDVNFTISRRRRTGVHRRPDDGYRQPCVRQYRDQPDSGRLPSTDELREPPDMRRTGACSRRIESVRTRPAAQ